MRLLRILPFITLLPLTTTAQDLAIGDWRVHLPFNRANHVSEAGNEIFCAADAGIFIYHKADQSVRTVSKVEGLSDVNISILRHNASGSTLIAGYENGNIDILRGTTILNISDLKRKNIIGSKRINDIFFNAGFAYLATDIGILLLDLTKNEIKDTYFLSSTGDNNPVHDITTNGSVIYAATDSGIYTSAINNPSINFFGSWSQLRAPVAGFTYAELDWFDGKLVLGSLEQSSNDDSLLYHDGTWNALPAVFNDIRSLRSANGRLCLTGGFGVKEFNSAMSEQQQVAGNNEFSDMQDAIPGNQGIIWIADRQKGLVRAVSSMQYTLIAPNGPRSGFSSDIRVLNGQLWVGHAVQGRKWDNLFTRDGFSTFFDGRWTTYDRTNVTSNIVDLDTLWDFMAVAIHPQNSARVLLGSRGAGLLEFENGKPVNYYNESNSTLQTAIGNPGSCQTGGVGFDSNLNLWVVNSTVAKPLSVRRTDGSWEAFSFPGAVGSGAFAGELMIDAFNQKWVDFNESGILVFDETGTIGTQPYRFLKSGTGQGGLPSNDVRAIVEDLDGQVWIGTTKGVAVFFSPFSVLDENLSPDAQQILIQVEDGTFQYLLESETVTSIAVDGANNKWYGTENSGVFLLSADDNEQIFHFTEDNSPLLSNNISTIGVDQQSGEVFFGTENGMISFRGYATEGKDFCENTYVFPNPVRPDYSGPIAITGVMRNGNIKITDVSGTLVFETTAQGGQGFWNGRNFNGEKAHTGVYLVFCSDADGENTCITKLLFIN